MKAHLTRLLNSLEAYVREYVGVQTKEWTGWGEKVTVSLLTDWVLDATEDWAQEQVKK